VARFDPVDPRVDLPAMERGILEFWRSARIFEKSLTLRADAPEWVFYEGPPTANGRPGIHHTESRTFKDLYPRYRTMTGHRVRRKAGWDCHGLPVELEVEREIGTRTKRDIEAYGIAEFNRRCRESVTRYVEDWERMTERLGFWIDLSQAYWTMDTEYIESVWWSLKELHRQGFLYEAHRSVAYCPRCGTALSDHEVAQGYATVTDPSVFAKFRIIEAPDPDLAGAFLVAWTTTPWTLPSNLGLAVDPGEGYALVEAGGERLIVAERLRDRVLGESAGTVRTIPGRRLLDGDGTRYEPLYENVDGTTHRVIGAADFVSMDEGTGIIHVAPGFGAEDLEMGRREGWPVYRPIDDDGRFTDEASVAFVRGRAVKEADPDIIDDLRRRGLLLRAETYEHTYPLCWRCDTPLLYMARTSWYVRTTARKERLLAVNESVNWYPDHIKHGRYGDWLENNVDWALSRERYWGTPLPIWRADDGEAVCIGSVAELRELGAEVPDDLHRPFIDEVRLRCEVCGEEMRRVEEVIDAWYDSGSMPFAQFHYPFEGEELFEERFPAEFICEAIDQTRGWFYSLLAVSTLLFDTTSYRHCVCLGLILDPEGQKMSKSRGNVVEPDEVITRHGADAFRWYYFTAQQPWAGFRFSVDTVGESVRQFMLTLWNTYAFWVLYANAEGLAPSDFTGSAAPAAPSAELTDLDRWVLSRLQTTKRLAIDHLDAYDSTRAGQALAAYVDELSNWYVRLSRRRFWEGDRTAFATLRHCLLEVAGLLAPFVPFLSDELHLNLGGGVGEEFGELPDSVHLRDYPEPDDALLDPELESGMSAVRRTVELGRAARAQAGVKVRQPLRKAVIVASGAERESIERLSGLVAGELNVKQLEFVAEEAELVRYEVKPNYRALGPRFGRHMPQVAAAVAALDPAGVAEAVKGERRLGIQVDGTEHELGPDDVTLVLQPLDGYQVEAEAGHAVALALELDDELRREGLAREIVHAVQIARREAGLEITDRIDLTLGGDSELLEAARAHEAYLAGETLAKTIAYDGDEAGAAAAIEGRELRIAIERS
jgi:isoleucyl-tRNA synthetase